MSDIKPNLALNRKRLDVERSTMLLNKDRMDLRLLELEDEKIKISENMTQTDKRIQEIDEQLKLIGG
jgi:hypothetical protein